MHFSVMKNEAIKFLDVRPGGFYVDATFGRGGHTREILAKAGVVLAFDSDPEAISEAQKIEDPCFFKVHESFGSLEKVWNQQAMPAKVDGILLDLGVSSPQLDQSFRGFSFMQDCRLDMRFNNSSGPDAVDWLNSASFEEMVRVFFEYGEERNARKIAQSILEFRRKKTLLRSSELVKIVASVNGFGKFGKHPATRVFQAIRMHINNEISELHSALLATEKILKEAGRLVVISFHSIEDRIVKNFFKRMQWPNFLEYPSLQEVGKNPRSRSAKLRYGVALREIDSCEGNFKNRDFQQENFGKGNHNAFYA